MCRGHDLVFSKANKNKKYKVLRRVTIWVVAFRTKSIPVVSVFFIPLLKRKNLVGYNACPLWTIGREAQEAGLIIEQVRDLLCMQPIQVQSLEL